MKRDYKDILLWNKVKKEEWDSWEWQIKNRITSIEELEQIINLSKEEKEKQMYIAGRHNYWLSLGYTNEQAIVKANEAIRQ